MALTGHVLLLLLVVATGVAPVCVWWAWSRVRGPDLFQASQRVGLVVLAQVATAMVVLVALNDYGQFYTSWSDLLGVTPPKAGAVRHFGAGAGVPAARQQGMLVLPTSRPVGVVDPGSSTIFGHRATSWSSPSHWADDGAVVALNLTGPQTGYSQPAYVYLPPQYFSDHPQRRFPLVEVFTGFPGHPELLLSRLNYPRYLLDGIRVAALRPMVLVLMRPTVDFPRDTECMDIPHGPQSLTYFAEDVPSAVADAFGVTLAKAAAVGDSSGGYCALHLAMTHPRLFVAAASLSGYYRPVSDNTTGDLYLGSLSARNEANLDWRLRNLRPPAIDVFVATSHSETGYEGYSAARKFLELIRPPMSGEEFQVTHGGHNFATWNLEIPPALSFLSLRL